MTARRDGAPGQLALVPLHGNIDKRPRCLDRDVSTIGRARGCDLRLDAAEISTLHCTIYRTPEGYRVKDSGSRTGTRVNGHPTKNGNLHDGDVLQLGPFSFEVKVPAYLFGEAAALDPAKVRHWQASRRRLAAVALRLRRRLHDLARGPVTASELEHQRKAQQLRDRLHQYEERLTEMEAAERELDADRQALRRERETHHEHVRRVETELAGRLEQAEQEIHRRWAEFQQRCKVEEARLLAEADRLAAVPLPEETVARMQELESRTQEVARQQEQVRRRQQELDTMKQQLTADADHARADLEKQRAALAQQEANLKVQRAEVIRMLSELKKVQEELRQQQKGDFRALQQENAELRQMLTECEERLAAAANTQVAQQGHAAGELQAENELLRKLLEEKEQVIGQLHDRSAVDLGGPDLGAIQRELEHLRSENDALRQLLDEKPPAAPAPKNAGELESYEAELNQFRQQLEADRAKVQDEWEQIRQRQEEMEEAIREMEMQLSRERAEMARERTRVDRLREELRADTERLQRERDVRDSLAPVNKLREEMQRRPGTRSAL